jgi:hypothetical protein
MCGFICLYLKPQSSVYICCTWMYSKRLYSSVGVHAFALARGELLVCLYLVLFLCPFGGPYLRFYGFIPLKRNAVGKTLPEPYSIAHCCPLLLLYHKRIPLPDWTGQYPTAPTAPFPLDIPIYSPLIEGWMYPDGVFMSCLIVCYLVLGYLVLMIDAQRQA